MIAYSMGAMTALEFLSREKNSFIKKYLHIDFPVVFYDKNNNNSFFRNSISNDLHNSHKDLIADLKKDKYHKKVKLDNDEISYVTELYFKHYKELLNVSLANNVLSMTLNMVPEILIKKTMPDINIVHYILMSLYFNGGNFVDRARKIKAHTFLVACTKESLFDCHTVLAFSKLIKRTEKIVIKNGSHSCLFTNPIQIQKVLRRFLE